MAGPNSQDNHNAPFERHLPVGEPTSAVELLASNCPLSKQQIKQAMKKGAVWLTRNTNTNNSTKRLRRHSKQLQAGDTLHLYYDPKVLSAEPPPAQLIADEGAYSVWYKPYGMLSQGSKWGDHCTINRWAESQLQPQRPAFIIHRLDRAATGLILIGHQRKATAALAALFEQRLLEKRYRVIVHGEFPEQPQQIDQPIDDRPARTHAQLLEYDPTSDRSLLDIRIETGRKHQIRRHLAGIGFPVVGDRLHGRDKEGENLQLTACSLAFRCPLSGEERHYQLPESLLPQLST